MCGLSLIYSRSNAQSLKEIMRASLNTLAHRGPDDWGIWQRDEMTIGHRRLSIIDLEHSLQPFKSPEDRYALAFNGEIYNYQQLRRELQGKWNFLTNGDTEVLLAGLIVEGNQFVEKLEGMWAFAFWDSQQEELMLCRDRMGKKPLYYSDSGSVFCVSSELPALKCLLNHSLNEDLDSVADFFRYGYCLPGHTFYENVCEVLPANYLIWKPGCAIRTESYWTPVIKPFQGSYSDAVDSLRSTLTSAVKKRLVSDVEVGCFLSGGIDSSVIAALAASQREGSKALKTFTTAFTDKDFDESSYARKVASHLNLDHHEGKLDSLSVADLEKLILERVGQPFMDSSILPTACVANVASSKVKVVLSGDGSDELFAGYQRYKARAIMNYYLRLPDSLRAFFRRQLRKIPEPRSHHSRSLIKKMHLFFDIEDRRKQEQPYIAPVLFGKDSKSGIFPPLENRGHSFSRPWECSFELPDVKEMMLSDTFVYLPQDIHVKVDRATMHHSIEARAPFMDINVVELAMSLPLEWTFSYRKNKRILHDAFKDLLPDVVWKRRKQGFAVPLGAWFTGELSQELKSQLSMQEGNLPFNSAEVNQLITEHCEGRRDNGYRLWMFFVYCLWRQQQCGE